MSGTDTSSLSGISGTTYSPKSSSHVGTSSSSFGISSTNSSIKSMDLVTHNNSSNLKMDTTQRTNEDNTVPEPNSPSEENSQAHSLHLKFYPKLPEPNSPSEENSQAHSLPIYPKSPVVDNETEESLDACSQDLFKGNQGERNDHYRDIRATSTPFGNARKKEQAHFSSLQLSNGSSVDKYTTNISVSDAGSSSHAKPSSPVDIVEKKLRFDSPSIDVIKKHDSHFSSLHLSSGSSIMINRSVNDISVVSDSVPSIQSKLSSPIDIIEKKLHFDSPSIDVDKKDSHHTSLYSIDETSCNKDPISGPDSGPSHSKLSPTISEKLHFNSPSIVIDEKDSNFCSLKSSSTVTISKSSISVPESGPSINPKPSTSIEIGEKKLSTDSVDATRRKDQAYFSSLQLSGESSSAYNLNIDDSSIHSKPVLLSSPSESKVVVEKQLFDSPPREVVVASEKGSETLDIPMWCKDNEGSNELTEDTNISRTEKSTNVVSEMESVHFKKVDNDKQISMESELGLNNQLDGGMNDACDFNKDVEYKSNSVPDIFNPIVSQMTEKSACTQLSNCASSFDENLPQMNFDLSQPESHVSNGSGCFTSLQKKIDFTKSEVVEEQKPSCSKSVETKDANESNQLSSNLSCTVDNKDLSTSLSDISKCDVSEDICIFKVGMPVFAMWNKIYYPGIVVKIEDSTSLTIHFHDDQVVTMPKKNAFLHKLVSTHGQQCKVKVSDEYYDDAIMMASYEYENEIYYAVLVNDEHTVVDRNSICFSQLQRQKLFVANVADQNIMPRKRRRTEPVLSSGSENYFIAKTPSKKLKYSHKLFEGLTICIIPEDMPVMCSSIVTTSMDEETQVDDFPFNVIDLKKVIEENGGICIPKLHGRDMQRANKLICIARSHSASLPFIYAVVVGIPVLHYDWIYRSIECKRLKPYEKGEYVLPAGIDIFGDVVEQNITKRDPYTPLNLLRFYVHTDGEIKNQNRLLDMILYKCGSERLFSSMYVTEKTKKLPFNIHNIDFVLTVVDRVPIALINAAAKANKNIVTATWFVQCLINNELLDTMDCPEFRYSEPQLSIAEAVDEHADTLQGTSRCESGSPEFE